MKGDYANVMARIFDRNDLNKNKFPSVLEFELSNTCNLECKMCLGTLSSSIRKNRDGLPLLPMVYDAVFVEQLKEFIPHAYEAKFYGGEPFLINIYFDILDVIARLNPEIVITITTNGTVLNPKIKDLFEKLKFNINVSIDSVTQATYEKIRINADFDKVMENMHWFRDYCRKNGTIFCICVNPMRQNWQEIPEIIKFFNELEVLVSFNTVYDPPDCSLWNLDSVEIMEIIKKYSEIVLPSANLTEEHNLNKFNGLIRQLETWHNESYENKLNDFKSCIV